MTISEKPAPLTRQQAKKLADKHYYERNKDRLKEKQRQYHHKNRDTILEQMRSRVVDNKKLYKQRKQNHPEYIKVSKANATAKSWLAEGRITSLQVRQLLEAQNNKCHYCNEELSNYSLDHVIPFCKGGSNYISNIVIACRPCNFKKHTTDYESFTGRRTCE